MSKKLNIVFICNELPSGITGGIGVFIDSLSKRLSSKGHKVFIIGFIDNVKTKEYENIKGITIIKLPSQKSHFSIFLDRVILYKEVLKLISSHEIDIIEAPDFEGLAGFLPRGKHKLVIRLHGTHTYFANEMNEKPSFLIKALEKYSLKKADNIISVSQYTANITNEIFDLNKKIDVIYNGIDLPRLDLCKSSWSRCCKVVFTGSLMKKKGVFSIAKAWPLVKKEFPNAELIMIGKDTVIKGKSAKVEIERIAKDQSISFLGHLPKTEMESILVKCDVAIYPSYSETFGLAPIESMALMVPTIYTQLSCGPEIMQTRELVDICVNPDDHLNVANILIKLLRSENLRCHIAKLGRKLVQENYSNEAKTIDNEAFYKRVVKDA